MVRPFLICCLHMNRGFCRLALLLCVCGVIRVTQAEGGNVPISAAASSANTANWYFPPPSADASRVELLPICAEQVAIPVNDSGRDLAIQWLAGRQIRTLSLEDCRRLHVEYTADRILHQEIASKRLEIARARKWLSRNSDDKSVPQGSIVATRQHVTDVKARIEHAKQLIGDVMPYLVRAVSGDGVDGQFSASLWHGTLIISHISYFINDLPANNATVGQVDSNHLRNAPVVVFLPARPDCVYTLATAVRLSYMRPSTW